MSINSCTLVGRLAKDLDLKYLSDGNAVASFTLAVNRNFKNAEGEYEADFINCTVWRKAAETMANYTRKGSQVGVTGRIQTRNYENQQGQRVYVTELVVDEFTFLDPKNSRQDDSGQRMGNHQDNSQRGSSGNYGGNRRQGQQGDTFAKYGNSVDIGDDDVPF